MHKLTVTNLSVENMLFDALAVRVVCHEVSSPLCFFGDWIFFYGDPFTIKGRQKVTFWKSELGVLAWGNICVTSFFLSA